MGAGDRGEAQRHPDVDEYLDTEPGRHPDADQAAVDLVTAGSDPQDTQEDDSEQDDDRASPRETEFLGCDTEDEVGVLFWDELAAGLPAVEEPGAAQAARADRDERLVDVVSAPSGSACGSRKAVNRATW